VPTGSTTLVCTADVSGSNIFYNVVVVEDVAHSATVTLTLGTASRAYPWASVVIDSSGIYTFPTGLSATVSLRARRVGRPLTQRCRCSHWVQVTGHLWVWLVIIIRRRSLFNSRGTIRARRTHLRLRRQVPFRVSIRRRQPTGLWARTHTHRPNIRYRSEITR
jgi:hypothetical protein